jgi:hypothetical protein
MELLTLFKIKVNADHAGPLDPQLLLKGRMPLKQALS